MVRLGVTILTLFVVVRQRLLGGWPGSSLRAPGAASAGGSQTRPRPPKTPKIRVDELVGWALPTDLRKTVGSAHPTKTGHPQPDCKRADILGRVMPTTTTTQPDRKVALMEE